MINEQLIADAIEAGACFGLQMNEAIFSIYQIAAFAAIRDKRKDAEIARLREALQVVKLYYPPSRY
jgi:hypothetical protein